MAVPTRRRTEATGGPSSGLRRWRLPRRWWTRSGSDERLRPWPLARPSGNERCACHRQEAAKAAQATDVMVVLFASHVCPVCLARVRLRTPLCSWHWQEAEKARSGSKASAAGRPAPAGAKKAPEAAYRDDRRMLLAEEEAKRKRLKENRDFSFLFSSDPKQKPPPSRSQITPPRPHTAPPRSLSTPPLSKDQRNHRENHMGPAYDSDDCSPSEHESYLASIPSLPPPCFPLSLPPSLRRNHRENHMGPAYDSDDCSPSEHESYSASIPSLPPPCFPLSLPPSLRRKHRENHMGPAYDSDDCSPSEHESYSASIPSLPPPCFPLSLPPSLRRNHRENHMGPAYDSDDDDNMEVGFSQLMAEERRSALIARKEDEREAELLAREEEERARRKKAKKMGRN
ncbi:unnamed protein product [Closterium sp. Naga37s-1]|nr:unnamed protein product [Closterium sp. Naga37s-1]